MRVQINRVMVVVSATLCMCAACGLEDVEYDRATTHIEGTNPKRFVDGMGIAWGSQWSQLTTQPDREEWDRVNLVKIATAGATSTNLSFDWINIQPNSRTAYDWSYVDNQVVQAEKRGLEMFAYTGNTPGWALATRFADPDVARCSGKPNNPLFPPGENAQGISDFNLFYQTLSARYCGRVKYYEFWNEPNGCWWMSCGCGDQTAEQKAEYARWLKRWYLAMKQGCPDVVLSVGGLDCAWGGNAGAGTTYCVNWLEELYVNGGGSYFDAVALHPYGYDSDLQDALVNNKTLNWNVIDGVTSLLASQGQAAKNLWLSEWGFMTSDDVLKGQLVQATLNALLAPTQYLNVFRAKYLAITDLPNGQVWGLADSSTTAPFTVTPRGSWRKFRDVAIGPDTQRLLLDNPGMEFSGVSPTPEHSAIWGWGPDGRWASHLSFPRSRDGVLGRNFGYYDAGNNETVGQVLDVTYQPDRTYTFQASVHGGLDNAGTLPFEFGYQSSTGEFVLLRRRVVTLGSTWVDRDASYNTPSSGVPIGQKIWVRFGTGGSTDAWFDNLNLTVSPPH